MSGQDNDRKFVYMKCRRSSFDNDQEYYIGVVYIIETVKQNNTLFAEFIDRFSIYF